MTAGSSLQLSGGTLPSPLTPLIDRQEELEAIRRNLLTPGVCLLTLTGPAGTGKTRLAIEAAKRLADAFVDGWVFVDFAPIEDPQLLMPTLARQLGMTDTADEPLAAALRRALRETKRLIVLDNLEQLVAAAAQVAELLPPDGECKMLATSRTPLHIRGERQFPVPPLRLPQSDRVLDPAELAKVPAVDLFVQRAQAVQPAFELTRDNAQAVAEICIRLDGLPLAIELASSRSKLLPPSALLTRLRQSALAVLHEGFRDQPLRHQALRTAIGSSYELLSREAQTLFRWLGVFMGSLSLEAAEAIAQELATAERTVLDVLGELVDSSLLHHENEPGGAPQYRMLETVREYAVDCLQVVGELDQAKDRHVAFYLGLAEAASVGMRGPAREFWLLALAAEYSNLRAALSRALDGRHTDQALRLAAALALYWDVRRELTEGRGWLTLALAAAGETISTSRARALNAAGFLARRQADYAGAEEAHRTAGMLYESLGDARGASISLGSRGLAAYHQGQLAEALLLCQRAIAAVRPAPLLGPPSEPPEPSNIPANSLALKQQLALVFNDLADVANAHHDHLGARLMALEALGLHRQLGDKIGAARSLAILGTAARLLWDVAAAADWFEQSLALISERGVNRSIPPLLRELADIAFLCHEPERAARFFGAAEALAAFGGSSLPLAPHADREALIEATRSTLGEAAFARAWAAGQSWSVGHCLAEAAELRRSASKPIPSEVAQKDGRLAALTVREREVAALVGRGMTNRQIGEALVITEGTATLHVKHILTKLDLANRAQIAALVAGEGLLPAAPSGG